MKDNDLHCHVVSKNDIIKAVGKLKSDKMDVEGRVLSNNYIHGTDYLFMHYLFIYSLTFHYYI